MGVGRSGDVIGCLYLGIGGISKLVDVPIHVGGGIREFVNYTDRPAFLESELVGLGVDGYR